jgi:hypothetical protein
VKGDFIMSNDSNLPQVSSGMELAVVLNVVVVESMMIVV